MYIDDIIMSTSNIKELVPYIIKGHDINLLVENLVNFTKDNDLYNSDLNYLDVFNSIHEFLYKDRGYMAICLPDLLYNDISARGINFKYINEINSFAMNMDLEVCYHEDMVIEDPNFMIFFVEDKYNIYPVDKEHFKYLVKREKELFKQE